MADEVLHNNAVSGEFSGDDYSEVSTPASIGSISLADYLNKSVDFNEIVLKEKVGHGSYGVVYKAVWRDLFVAVKEFEASAEQKAIETEIKQLSRVCHHNIISLFGISANQQSKYLIMEYAEGGSLHNFLHGKEKPYYTTAHAMSWARQCAEGVAYLHAMKPKPLIHRDLKPLNLLLTNKGRHLKICDFGTVADKSTWMTNNKGSAAWMAPEVFEGSKYTEKCDIFSWAIVLWEVLSRQQPFKEIDNTYSIMWKIHKGERPPMIKDCPPEIQNLMKCCWETAPDKRPAMQHVVSVMNELITAFTGADEALEYEFTNQQIIRTDSRNPVSADNYTLDFSSFYTSSSNPTSTQLTPTNLACNSNTSNSLTPTNSDVASSMGTNIFNPHSNVPTAAITATSRWGAIPEESDDSHTAFNLTPSAETAKRYETIRNGMTQMASVLMAPISVDVDPNAWNLSHSDSGSSIAKSDAGGKERLTVTDTKPMHVQPNATMTAALNANNTERKNIINQHLSSANSIVNAAENKAYAAFQQDEEDDDDDDDENYGPDQSFHEMLDPELQPEKPIPDNQESQAIYREHRRLAKEYLRLDTKLYYAEAQKEKCLRQMNDAERQQKQELMKKLRDKEELLKLYHDLEQQLEQMRPIQADPHALASASVGSSVPTAAVTQRQAGQNAAGSEVVADDGWVMIAPNQNT